MSDDTESTKILWGINRPDGSPFRGKPIFGSVFWTEQAGHYGHADADDAEASVEIAAQELTDALVRQGVPPADAKHRVVRITITTKVFREGRAEEPRGGESYFRHRIMQADNGWLEPSARSTPTGESSTSAAATDRPSQPQHPEHHEGGDADHDQDQQDLCGSKVSHRSNVAGHQVTGAPNE